MKTPYYISNESSPSRVDNYINIGSDRDCGKGNKSPKLKYYRKLETQFSNYLNLHLNSAKLIVDNSTLKNISASDYIKTKEKLLLNSYSQLTPILYKSIRKMKNQKERQDFYKIERSIVKMRMMEYEKIKKKIIKNSKKNYTQYENNIILIQRYFREYIKRKKNISSKNTIKENIDTITSRKENKNYINNNNSKNNQIDSASKEKIDNKSIKDDTNIKGEIKRTINQKLKYSNQEEISYNPSELENELNSDKNDGINQKYTIGEKEHRDKIILSIRKGSELMPISNKSNKILNEDKENSITNSIRKRKLTTQSKKGPNKEDNYVKQKNNINNSVNPLLLKNIDNSIKELLENKKKFSTNIDYINPIVNNEPNEIKPNLNKSTILKKENILYNNNNTTKLKNKNRNSNLFSTSITPKDDDAIVAFKSENNIKKIILIQGFFRNFLSKKIYQNNIKKVKAKRKRVKERGNLFKFQKKSNQTKYDKLLAVEGTVNMSWIKSNKINLDKVTLFTKILQFVVSKHKITDKIFTMRILKKEFLNQEESSEDTIEDKYIFNDERKKKIKKVYKLASSNIKI